MRPGKYPPHWGRADFAAMNKGRVATLKREIQERLFGKGVKPAPDDARWATFWEAYETLASQGVVAMEAPQRKLHVRRILDTIESKNQYLRWVAEKKKEASCG